MEVVAVGLYSAATVCMAAATAASSTLP